MRFVSLAWRNIRRNRRRTILTVAAFAIGVAALVLTWSIFDGSNRQMIDNMTGNYTGYIQIHRQGYANDRSVDLAFSSKDIARLKLEGIDGVAAISSRMETPALINSANNSRGLLLVGIDTGSEPLVTTLHRKIVAGRYLDSNQKGGILIGKPLAKVLGVGVGGEVAILTEGMQGSIAAMRYRVQGLYDTQNEMVDSMQGFITRADAEELLSSGDQVTTIVVKLTDRELSDSIVKKMSGLLGDRYEVEDWKALLPGVTQSITFHEAMGKAVTFILFGIVVIGVANTLLMSIMERLREFGVMMAMGTSSMQIFRLIIYEGLLLGLIGFVIGLTVGYVSVFYLGSVGMQFDDQQSAQTVQVMQTMQGIGNAIYPHLSLQRMAFIATAVFIVMMMATLYPAWKTARLIPLHAMHGLAFRRKILKAHANETTSTNRFLLLTLALRNLARHSRRFGLTMLAITFGLTSFIFMGSVANGYYVQLVENSTGMVTGDAQIQHKDFQSDMKLGLSLPDGMQLLDKLQQVPQIAASPRVETTAVITSAAKSEPILLVGVSPEEEKKVTFLHRAVKEGHYLEKGYDREIVIGKKLADLLHVRLGERVVVMAQDANGNLTSEAFVVAGMFSTGGHGFDKSLGHITLPASQKMLAMGNRITNIAMKIEDKEHIDPILQQAAALIPPGDSRLIRWQELLPEVEQLSIVFKRSLAIVLAIILAMVSVAVMNTVLMSVMERTREFGTMLALGSRPGLIVRLVMLESWIMGMAGTIAGLTLGTLIVLLHMGGGISMQAHGTATAVEGVTDVIYPKFSIAVLAIPGILLPVLVLLAALYPALRASRLEPVQAIRNG